MKKITIILATLVFATSVSAKVNLPSIICDNMVLQQQTDAALWGKASPGKTVTVSPSWTQKKYQTKADNKTGEWLLRVTTPSAGGPFEIAGEDRVFHKAHAMAEWGRDVTVWSEDVPEPVAVRYAFRNWGPGNLTNNFGIPAAPFRTDSWDDLER